MIHIQMIENKFFLKAVFIISQVLISAVTLSQNRQYYQEPLCLVRVLWRNSEYGFPVPRFEKSRGELKPGQWYHVVLSASEDDITLFLNRKQYLYSSEK